MCQFDTSPTLGWGKVGARSWARSGQGLDKKQGWGKVWTGKVWARFGQGSGKVWTKSKVRARSGQASCDPNVFYSYHSPKSISGFYHYLIPLSLSPYLFPYLLHLYLRIYPCITSLSISIPLSFLSILPQPCVGEVSNCH